MGTEGLPLINRTIIRYGKELYIISKLPGQNAELNEFDKIAHDRRSTTWGSFFMPTIKWENIII